MADIDDEQRVSVIKGELCRRGAFDYDVNGRGKYVVFVDGFITTDLFSKGSREELLKPGSPAV
jgi:hypothetical protein